MCFSSQIFQSACSSRDNPSDPRTSGGRFLRRCETLLIQKSPFDTSSVPLSSAFYCWVPHSWHAVKFLRAGNIMGWPSVWSLTWACIWTATGLAINAEDKEIRRRVFWGAFICDKLQSLFLGRPVTIQPRDAYVSCDLLDSSEEHEPWTPYIGPNDQRIENRRLTFTPILLRSVTAFQQLCALSKLITKDR